MAYLSRLTLSTSEGPVFPEGMNNDKLVQTQQAQKKFFLVESIYEVLWIASTGWRLCNPSNCWRHSPLSTDGPTIIVLYWSKEQILDAVILMITCCLTQWSLCCFHSYFLNAHREWGSLTSGLEVNHASSENTTAQPEFWLQRGGGWALRQFKQPKGLSQFQPALIRVMIHFMIRVIMSVIICDTWQSKSIMQGLQWIQWTLIRRHCRIKELANQV